MADLSVGGEETDKSSCGTYSLSATAGETSDYCVPGLTTTIVLPTGATQSQVFLHATALETAFTLPGITTTFVKDRLFARIGSEANYSARVCQKLKEYSIHITYNDMYYITISAENRPSYLSFSSNPILAYNAYNNP